MKRILSLFLSITMLLSMTAGMDLSAYAAEKTLEMNNCWLSDAITETEDTQYYMIILKNDCHIEILLMHYFGARIQLYNNDISECILNCNDAGGNENNPVTNKISGDLSKGIYYIKITGYLDWSNPTTGKYKLKCSVDHSWSNAVVTKATASKDGKIAATCSVCGETLSTAVIPKASNIKLSKTSYIYNGKVQKPGVTVKDSKGKTLKNGTDYTVSYAKGRKAIGKYAVKVTFKGKYSGSKTLYFTITPKATALSGVAAKSKGFTVKWKKQTSQTTGYQMQYSTDKNFKKNNKTVTVTKNKTTSKTISKLKGKKKYYVRIRTYKTVKVNGKNTKIYSAWSKAKSVTTKK